jgi:outer membrane lipoprotein-sorting protein
MMMNRIILLLLLASAFIAGCASSNTCPKVPSEGNISSPFNTDNDEYSPSFWDNSFYYTVSNRQENKRNNL